GRIFNLGHPGNDRSIRELAETMVRILAEFPKYVETARAARLVEQSADDYYGREYQDILRRVPSISRAREQLGWEPKIGFDEGIRRTIAFYVETGTLPDQRA